MNSRNETSQKMSFANIYKSQINELFVNRRHFVQPLKTSHLQNLNDINKNQFILTQQLIIMIDQDYKFFRQNFSASSFSQESNPVQSLLETRGFKNLTTKSKKQSQTVDKNTKITNQQHKDHRRTQSYIEKKLQNQVKRGPNWVEGKEVQMKILQKLKNQHQGIKYMESNVSENRAQDRQQQKISSLKDISRQKKMSIEQKINSASIQKQMKKRNQLNQQQQKQRQIQYGVSRDLKSSKQQKRRENQYYDNKLNKLNSQISDLNLQLKEKNNLIQRLRLNQSAFEDKHNAQIRDFQAQLQQYVQENNSLRKQIILKEAEINQLRQSNKKMTSDPHTFRLEQELRMMKNKQKQYLQTIQRHEQQNNRDSYPGITTYTNNRDSNADISAEISRLRQNIDQRDQRWIHKLSQAIQKQRKASFLQAKKLMLNNENDFQTINSNHFQLTGSKSQIMSILDMVMSEIQELKKQRIDDNPMRIAEQLTFIKDFISKLEQQNTDGAYQRPFQLQDEQGMVGLLKTELQNYKKFIIDEEKSKRQFLQELNLYREQNFQVIKENGYLRQQLGVLQLNLSKPSGNNFETEDVYQLKEELRERNDRIMRYEQQIDQMQSELMNSQPQRPMILNGGEDSSELHLKMQRLHHLLEAESQHFIWVNNEMSSYFQSQVKVYEDRIQVYDEYIRTIQAHLKQNQIRVHHLVSRSGNDANTVMQMNHLLQQEAGQFRNQLGVLITTNRQIQTQLREQGQNLDQIWENKKIQFNNSQMMIQRMREQQ